MPSRFTSEIKLYEVHDIGNGRFPAFSTIAKQTQYFESKKKATISNCKLVRGGGTVRVNVSTKSFYKSMNYLSYKNPDYDNKVFYAFITGYKYINDQCTELSFAIDFIQTFMFDIECVGADTVLDREHLSQARKALATSNKFDVKLWELETPEALPVGKELETFGLNFTPYKDFIPAAEGGANVLHKIETDAGMLFPNDWYDINAEAKTLAVMYVSHIDFTDLDAAAQDEGISPLPSEIFDDWLNETNLGDTEFTIDFDGITHKSNQSIFDGVNLMSEYPNVCAVFGRDYDNIQGYIDQITKWGCVSSIVNIVVLPAYFTKTMFYTASSQGEDPGYKRVNVYVPSLTYDEGETSVHNEKLYRFPYSYIRLITPDGNKKELRWERFGNLAFSEYNFAQIWISCDIINGVSLIASPAYYENNYKAGYPNNTPKISADNTIIFNNIPTAPYNIDAYLSQMSAVAAEKTKRTTQEWVHSTMATQATNAAQAAPVYGFINGVAGNIGAADEVGLGTGAQHYGIQGYGRQMMSSVPALAKGVIDAGVTSEAAQERYESSKWDWQTTANAAAYLVGDDQGVFAQNYAMTRAAYASDSYVAPSGGGFENFTVYGWLNIACQRVRLRDEILKKYDEYFSSYGYTSGRMGEPYVMSFIRGGSDSPEWINGETYCKTSTAHFKGTFEYVCKLWADTFNAGIHWLNGDELING